MKYVKFRLICIVITCLIILCSFASENPYFTITGKDVKFVRPQRFPNPVYNFKHNAPTAAGFILGRRLFYDPILSRDGSTSCSSCHQRFAAFAHIDHALGHGINGLIGKRNVPALQNLAWQSSFMWDGGINHLELQPIGPITNPVEMDETMQNVIKKLQENKLYVELFKQAFNDSIVNSEKMLKALAQFLSLMVSSNARYDKYMAHKDTFSKQELNGLVLFRAHCENCHKEPLFTDYSFRNIGLKPDTALKDSGRYKVTGLIEDYMKFKVPSLRNVEMTYPYMHDGRFRNLKQVLNHYALGKFFTGNYDHSIDRNVGLSEAAQNDIIAFLKTLTDNEFLYDRRFADPIPYTGK